MKKLVYCTCLFLAACGGSNDQETTETAPSREETLKAAVAAHPDSTLAVEALSQYYRNNGNYDQAIASINSALEKDSANARLWDIKGTLHFENEDTLQAIAAYEKSVELFPEPGVLISLAVAYAYKQNPLALAIANGLLQGNKAAAEKEALFIKGLYFRKTGDLVQALKFYDLALAVNYSFMEAYREKAQVLYDQGNYQQAADVLTKAVTLQNNYDEGYYYLGRNLEKLNRRAEAIEMYRRALLYDPQYTEAKDALARLGIKN